MRSTPSQAAKAGKHVFCEKPLEISVERCQQMIDACKAADRLLGTAYRCQYDPHHLECIRLAREKVFGTPAIIEAGFAIDVGEPDQWRLKRALSGGGALMDVGIYALQATRYLTGEEPILVSGIETKTDPVKFAEVDETVVWTTKFPSGVVAHCSTSYKAGGISNLRVTAERGWFELDPAFYLQRQPWPPQRRQGNPLSEPIDLFAAEMDDFARCILNKTPSKVPGEEGLRDVRIMRRSTSRCAPAGRCRWFEVLVGVSCRPRSAFAGMRRVKETMSVSSRDVLDRFASMCRHANEVTSHA